MNQAAIVLLVAALLALALTKRSARQKRDRFKKIPAPLWAKHLWHIVPEELRNELTLEDWESMRDINPYPTRQFCDSVALATRPFRVVVSLTTSPDRLVFVPIVLNQLDLTLVDEIALNLPRKFGRKQQTYDSIPSTIETFPKLRIYWHDVDDGPIMKILPTVERERAHDPNTVCIALDDDMCYPRSLIRSLVSAQVATGGQVVVGGMGTDIKHYLKTKDKQTQIHWYESLRPSGRPGAPVVDGLATRDFLEGFGSICYRARHLDGSRLRSMLSLSKTCFQSDDLLLNIDMQMDGVSRAKLVQFKINGYSFGNQGDALHLLQHHNVAYGSCIDLVRAKQK